MFIQTARSQRFFATSASAKAKALAQGHDLQSAGRKKVVERNCFSSLGSLLLEVRSMRREDCYLICRVLLDPPLVRIGHFEFRVIKNIMHFSFLGLSKAKQCHQGAMVPAMRSCEIGPDSTYSAHFGRGPNATR